MHLLFHANLNFLILIYFNTIKHTGKETYIYTSLFTQSVAFYCTSEQQILSFFYLYETVSSDD